jgi:hypothetical protein
MEPHHFHHFDGSRSHKRIRLRRLPDSGLDPCEWSVKIWRKKLFEESWWIFYAVCATNLNLRKPALTFHDFNGAAFDHKPVFITFINLLKNITLGIVRTAYLYNHDKDIVYSVMCWPALYDPVEDG